MQATKIKQTKRMLEKCVKSLSETIAQAEKMTDLSLVKQYRSHAENLSRLIDATEVVSDDLPVEEMVRLSSEVFLAMKSF